MEHSRTLILNRIELKLTPSSVRSERPSSTSVGASELASSATKRQTDNNANKLLYLALRSNSLLGWPLGAKYCNKYVCLSVWLSARISQKLHSRASPIFVHVSRGRGSVLDLQCCDMLRTSGFVDDVMFIHKQRNYCIDSNKILLNDKHQQVHIVGCAPGRSLLLYDCLVCC